MKIKIKDTFIKENLLTYVMVLCALACGVLGLFGSPINWTGVIWAFAAAITAFDLVIVDTVRLNEKRELKEELQHKNEYIVDLEVRIDDLKKERSDYAAKHEDATGQLQALDNEYQKLAKQHNAMGQDFSKLQKKYDDLIQANDVGSAVPTTPPKPKKNPVTSGKKKKTARQIKAELKEVQEAAKKAPAKKKYSKGDIARIQEEMKAGGMIKQSDDEE